MRHDRNRATIFILWNKFGWQLNNELKKKVLLRLHRWRSTRLEHKCILEWRIVWRPPHATELPVNVSVRSNYWTTGSYWQLWRHVLAQSRTCSRQHVWPTVGHVGGEVAADGLEVLHFLLLFLRRDVHRLKVHQLDQRAADVHPEPGEGCRAEAWSEESGAVKTKPQQGRETLSCRKKIYWCLWTESSI